MNAYEVTGNTVWSMPERLECEVLQKACYVNTLTFTFTFWAVLTYDMMVCYNRCADLLVYGLIQLDGVIMLFIAQP